MHSAANAAAAAERARRLDVGEAKPYGSIRDMVADPAIDALWPRPVVETAEPSRPANAWRYSGRWWSRPVAARRDRPWY